MSGSGTISVDEAARRLGISRASAYSGVKGGKIPSIRIGRRLLIPLHAFNEMLGIIPDVATSPAKASQEGEPIPTPPRLDPRPQTPRLPAVPGVHEHHLRRDVGLMKRWRPLARTHDDLLDHINLLKLRLPVLIRSGVYFLYRGHELQYIGQSVSIFRRIYDHLSAGVDFDSFAFVEFDPSELLEWEARYIAKFEPPLNGGKFRDQSRRGAS